MPLLLKWYDANVHPFPWRSTRNPYQIWLSEIMLQQTQVNTVVPFYNPTQDVIYFVEDIYGLSSITTNDDPPYYSKLITPVGITFNENTELTISVN